MNQESSETGREISADNGPAKRISRFTWLNLESQTNIVFSAKRCTNPSGRSILKYPRQSDAGKAALAALVGSNPPESNEVENAKNTTLPVSGRH